MKALEGRNNVKVYNLSAGKSLPDWLTERKKRKLVKRDVDIQHRIELIQDFDMPDISGCVKVSPDGQYILATGMYKPRVKCFEVSALSLKFERCFDTEVIQMAVLSEDYSKMVFLQEERYLEFHNQGGRWFRTRIPRFGRDMTYHYPSCDLYIAASGSEIYRLNLNQGRFLNSIQTDSPCINKCLFNPVHYLFACGSSDGKVESWDPRSKTRVGVLDCAIHMACEDIPLPFYKSSKEMGITSLAFNDGLTMGVGTHTGKILVYDIRSNKPMLIKDHMDGYPIKNIEFHPSSEMVLSMSCNAVKIWERETGKPHTSLESDVKFNDLCVIPDSGMIFIATEDPKMQIYFLPSLGPSPKWCGYLDTIIEELEEEEVTQTYDDYKFVTEEELKVLGLDDLIGSNVLRAVMHGYYIDVRLYNKAKQISNPFDYQEFIKQKVKQKIAEKTERKASEKSLPKVNQQLFSRLIDDKDGANIKQSSLAKELLKDNRFQTMFADDSFEIDKESDVFKLMQPILIRSAKSKKKLKAATEVQDGVLREQMEMDVDPSSDSDSIMSSDSDDERDSDLETPDVASRLSPEPQNEEEEEEEEEMEEKVRNSMKKKKKKRNIIPPSNAKPLPSSELTSADTVDELRQNSKKLGRMSLASRLEQTKDEDDDDQRCFGSHEVEFIPEGKKDITTGFNGIFERQKKHKMERKGLIRSGQRIKGNIRMNKPFS